MLIVTLLFMVCIGFYQYARWNYNRNMERLMYLDQFYETLNELNARVYLYTLDGDESVYREIWDRTVQMRGNLRELTASVLPADLYREIRDLEDMFYTYTQLTQRIYDHAYLCAQVTVSGKQVINQFYGETQEVYEALTSEFGNLYARILTWARDTQRRAEQRNTVLLFDCILVILVSAGILVHQMGTLSRGIVRPIQDLTESAGNIHIGEDTLQTGRYVICTPEMDEEIRQLVQGYNQMTERIQTQLAQIREDADTKERLKNQELENLRIANLLKTSELQALQMQINPHYLFNTLNMISQTAFLEDAAETKNLLDTAAALFRYTLDYSGREVTLAKELEILGSYVDLQERRFGERIRFDFKLDETFHDLRVPSMILQPLVENALIHGVPMKLHDAKIGITTCYLTKEEMGEITIEDNGQGMEKEQLEKVRAKMRREGSIGQTIGLNNVYQRLRIFYGDQMEMELFSEAGKGTTVCIRIPYRPDQQMKDSAAEGVV